MIIYIFLSVVAIILIFTIFCACRLSGKISCEEEIFEQTYPTGVDNSNSSVSQLISIVDERKII